MSHAPRYPTMSETLTIRSIYFHSLRSFDAAVTRPGRFDMLLFVGTPNLEARDLRIAQKLRSTRLDPAQQDSARVFAKEFMDSRWDQMRFLTFAESEVFANTIVELAVNALCVN